MKLLTKKYIENLKSKETNCNISIFVPTYIANNDEKNRIGFKNALKDVESKLNEYGVDEEKIDTLLKSINSVQENPDFWKYQSKGLVIYANESVLDFAQLPKRFNAFTYVGEDFYFKPVLSFIEEDSHAYLMTVSPNKVRLFTVSSYEIVEHDISDEFPKNVDESHWFTDRNKTLQGHNSGRTIFHGQGGGKDAKNEDIKRFFRDVNTGLEDFFRGRKHPLILAGVTETVMLFKDSFHYDNIWDSHISGNHDSTHYSELYDEVTAILNENKLEKLTHNLKELNEIKHTDKVVNSLEEIVKLSLTGKIDTLYIKNNTTKWGYIDKNKNSIKIEKEKSNGQVDIVNTVAVETILNGGEVKMLNEDYIKDSNTEFIALLRY